MNQKQAFIADFNRLFTAINFALANLNPETIIYHDSGWRVRDLLAHLAVWYGERIKCLRAYQQNKEYQIPDFDMNMFNHDTVAERAARSFAEIQAEWEQVHTDLLIELEAIPASDYDEETRYPWGAYGPISTLIAKLIDHAEEHLAEFVAAAG